MSSLKLGFTGPDSSGKSTLISALTDRISLTYSVGTLSIGEIARQSPFSLADTQSYESSEWILHRVVEAESVARKKFNILICDRTVFDIWVFSKMALRTLSISEHQLQSLELLIGEWIKSYKVIFYTSIDPNFVVKMENLHDGREELREQFGEVMRDGIARFQGLTQFVELPSSLDARMNVVLNLIKITGR